MNEVLEIFTPISDPTVKFVIVHEILNKPHRKNFADTLRQWQNFSKGKKRKKIIMASLIFISSLVEWNERSEEKAYEGKVEKSGDLFYPIKL